MDKQLKGLAQILIKQNNTLAYLVIGFFFIISAGLTVICFSLFSDSSFKLPIEGILAISILAAIGLVFIIIAETSNIRARDIEIKLIGEPVY